MTALMRLVDRASLFIGLFLAAYMLIAFIEALAQ